jgi:release factor glutamine methyltransferase
MNLEAWMRAAGLVRSDALVLLRELAGVSHAAMLAHPELPLDAGTHTRLDAAAQRLRAGEPLAYVLGWREFYGLRFSVSPAVLVPRPETELLVDFALAHLPLDERAKVLDLGTGSGAIAIAVAHARPQAEVWALDASADALSVAAGNARALLAPERPGGAMRLVQGDWFDALAAAPGNDSGQTLPTAPLVPHQAGRPGPAASCQSTHALRFNLILSNPPYVAAGDAHLAALVHEPQLALVGRASGDGLADIRRIIAAAPAHLAAGGWLALEHGYDQAEAVQDLLRVAGLVQIDTQADLAGIARMTIGQRPAGDRCGAPRHAPPHRAERP